MKGVILAAGMGTRLWPLTIDRAKPAVPFLNKPLIAYCIEYLYRFGIREVVINLHHRSESIRSALAGQLPAETRIFYSEEEQILGTGGALDRVRDLLSDGTFVVINGKILTEIELNDALRTHQSLGALATLVLRHNRARERFSIVETDGDHQITRFAGFPDPPAAGQGAPSGPGPLMFTGVQFLEPEIFDFIPRGVFSHTTTSAYPEAMRRGRLVSAHVSDAPWHELSTLERYLGTSLLLLGRAGQPVVLGEACHVDPTARLERCVLWNRVRVGADVRLTNCIVTDECEIPDGSRFERVAIARALPNMDGAPRGKIIGKNLVVEIS